MDPEQDSVDEKHFLNTTVHNIIWHGVTVTVKDGKAKRVKNIIENVEGIVESGEVCALMGPSGCGKTTLLNVLARRPTNAASVEGKILVNGNQLTDSEFRHISSFVEQQEIFTGSLTVSQTLDYASRLAIGRSHPNKRKARINAILESFGLVEQANTLVGTSMQKGISDGQKRRLGVATQLITGPKILFLDEPTSGLDSAASFQIINYLRALAKRNRLIMICSIHQPSASTFNLFDKLLLLSAGKTHYFGATRNMVEHYDGIGVEIPQRANPAEFVLELINIDFSEDRAAASQQMIDLQSRWQRSTGFHVTHNVILAAESSLGGLSIDPADTKPSVGGQIVTLLLRQFMKANRDAMAYRLRLVMYIGFAILTGTVWLQLDRNQESIQLVINALIVNCGFISFMAVTYVPAFIEDYQQYIQEHRNGLYGATRFCISNFIVGLPYLFLFSVMFSVIFYWLANFESSATAFFSWVMWLFLDLIVAEAVVVLAVSIIPNFVGALIVATLMNILFFATGGALVPPLKLNTFYKHVIYYWSYQGYVFQGMMVSQFTHQIYDCGSGCHCIYDSVLADKCQIPGTAVLDRFGYKISEQGKNVGIVISIIFGLRLASCIMIKLTK